LIQFEAKKTILWQKVKRAARKSMRHVARRERGEGMGIAGFMLGILSIILFIFLFGNSNGDFRHYFFNNPEFQSGI